MGKSKVKILVCAHKADFCKNDNVFMPIHVGKALTTTDLGITGDDTGDNISLKNRSYCELTGMYWAWKNLKDVEYVGLSHYRRYFVFQNNFQLPRELYVTTRTTLRECEIDAASLEKIFETYDIVLPKKTVFTTNTWVRWSRMRDAKELVIAIDAIKIRCPEYLEAFTYQLQKTNKLSQYCMFIMPWYEFEKYCTWLFDLLAEIEMRLSAVDREYYENSRIYGFLAELLINAYVAKNKLKPKYLSVVQLSDKNRQPNWFRYLGSRVKTEIRYAFGV